MKQNRIFIALAVTVMAFSACSGNKKEKLNADSSATSTTMSDSTQTDTTKVEPADSSRSFRNDRGTDSVTAGKTVPAKP